MASGEHASRTLASLGDTDSEQEEQDRIEDNLSPDLSHGEFESENTEGEALAQRKPVKPEERKRQHPYLSAKEKGPQPQRPSKGKAKVEYDSDNSKGSKFKRNPLFRKPLDNVHTSLSSMNKNARVPKRGLSPDSIRRKMRQEPPDASRRMRDYLAKQKQRKDRVAGRTYIIPVRSHFGQSNGAPSPDMSHETMSPSPDSLLAAPSVTKKQMRDVTDMWQSREYMMERKIDEIKRKVGEFEMEFGDVSSKQQFFEELEIVKALRMREVYMEKLSHFCKQFGPHLGKKNSRSKPWIKHELQGMILLLRSSSLLVVEHIIQWKEKAGTDRRFVWKGEDYLQKMKHDLDFFSSFAFLPSLVGYAVISNPMLIPPNAGDWTVNSESETESVYSYNVNRKRGNVKSVQKNPLLDPRVAGNIPGMAYQGPEKVGPYRRKLQEPNAYPQVPMTALERLKRAELEIFADERMEEPAEEEEVFVADSEEDEVRAPSPIKKSRKPGGRAVQEVRENRAATTIQAHHRGGQQRKQFRELKEQTGAAIKIQASERGRQGRKQYVEKRQGVAATKIQARYRGMRGRSEADVYKTRTNAAKAIQKSERGRVQRKKYKQLQKENRAATKIQANYRGYAGRKSARGVIRAEIEHIERSSALDRPGWEDVDASDEDADDEASDSAQEAAAVRIQAHYRGYRVRMDSSGLPVPDVHVNLGDEDDMTVNMPPMISIERGTPRVPPPEEAAELIQASFRGHHARSRYLQQKNSATKIQAHYRGYSTRKQGSSKDDGDDGDAGEKNVDEDAAATKIQAHYRGYSTRKQGSSKDDGDDGDAGEKNVDEDAAATKIQAHYRGFSTRKARQKSAGEVDVQEGLGVSPEVTFVAKRMTREEVISIVPKIAGAFTNTENLARLDSANGLSEVLSIVMELQGEVLKEHGWEPMEGLMALQSVEAEFGDDEEIVNMLKDLKVKVEEAKPKVSK